jgi:hypothetical protein
MELAHLRPGEREPTPERTGDAAEATALADGDVAPPQGRWGVPEDGELTDA